MKVPEAGPVSVVHTSNDLRTVSNVAALSDTQMHMAWLQSGGTSQQRVMHVDADFDDEQNPSARRFVSQPGVAASDPQIGSTDDQARVVWLAEDDGPRRVFERPYEPGAGLGPIRAPSSAVASQQRGGRASRTGEVPPERIELSLPA